MDRSNHYEAAFEAYLRQRGLGYVGVDETRRTSLDEQPIKSLDFVVYGAQGVRLLIDVKGRRFPAGPADKPRLVWESWSTKDDVEGLVRWADRFGPGYRGVLVFAYAIGEGYALPDGTPDVLHWKARRYLFRAVDVENYRQAMRVRSPKWGTVALPAAEFRRLVRPFWELTHLDAFRSAQPA